MIRTVSHTRGSGEVAVKAFKRMFVTNDDFSYIDVAETLVTSLTETHEHVDADDGTGVGIPPKNKKKAAKAKAKGKEPEIPATRFADC